MIRGLNLKKTAGRVLDYCFVLPAVLYLCAFIIYPVLYNFILSLNKIGMDFFMTRKFNFVGFSNYIKMFTREDGQLLNTLKNTLFFTVMSIALQMVISFSLALFLNQQSRFCRISRGVIIISYIVPQTITGLLFKFIFAKDGGIINFLFIKLGILDAPIGWLISPGTAIASIIVANVWIAVPFSMLLFTAGLTTVDPSYQEAAMIDGAGWWHRLFRITIPAISETIKVVVTLGFINTFKIFDLVLIMTNGGPGNTTEMLSIFSYKLSFQFHYYDESAAASNVLFFVLIVVGLFYIRTIQNEGEV
jgi:multiple sugar transport system permease protein